MQKKIAAVWMALMLACGMLLAGCGGAAQGGDGGEQPLYTFTDSEGDTVELYTKPRNVAVLFSSYAEVWALAGGEIAVTVGDSIERGFAAEGTPLVDDGSGIRIDNERLLALEPDFVIASAEFSAQLDTCRRLRAAGIPCAAFREENFGDYLAMLKIFTEINGTPHLYARYGTEVQARIEGILARAEERAAVLAEPVSVLFVRAGTGGSSTRAKTAENHFVGVMLKELGTFNIADEAKQLSESLSLEHVLLSRPDIIFYTVQGEEEAARAYMESVFAQPGWQGVTAVQTGQVYFLAKDLFNFKPNARWADAYAMLAEILYPQEAAA